MIKKIKRNVGNNRYLPHEEVSEKHQILIFKSELDTSIEETTLD